MNDCNSGVSVDDKIKQLGLESCQDILSQQMTCIYNTALCEVYLGNVEYNKKIIPAIYKYILDTKEGVIMQYLNVADTNLKIPKIYKCKKNVKSPNLKNFDELLVMEYIEPLPFDIVNMNSFDRLDIAKSVAKIVDQLHKLDIYHRDITPDNIIRNKKDNKWYIIDFGNATSELNDLYRLYKAPPTPNLAQDNFGILEIANIEFPKNWKSMPTSMLLNV